MFEDGVLRSMFGNKVEEVRVYMRKLLDVEHHDLFCSLNILKVIKSLKIRRAGVLTSQCVLYAPHTSCNLSDITSEIED
jgi:hypothetical protein